MKVDQFNMRTYDPASPQNTYLAEVDIDFCQSQLLELAYILGYSQDDLPSLTIDDIMEAIRSIFPYTRLVNTEYEKSLSAAETIGNANCILLSSCARRLWYRYNLAKAAL